MIDVRNIVLTEKEIQACVDFANNTADTHEAIEFGQTTTKARDLKELGRDIIMGKMAEIAFAKALKENYGVEVEIDFNRYPNYVGDDQDAEINGWKIDIKGTKQGSRWLLMDWYKLSHRTRSGGLSHFYIPFTVGWDRDRDVPKGWVRFEGVAWLPQLQKNKKHTEVLRKGQFIPDTKMRLQADNYGIRFKDLRNKFKGDARVCFDHFVKFILTSDPSPYEHIFNDYVPPFRNIA